MTDKTKVLIVEDDTPLAMFMVNVLSRAGCEVQVAHTGKKGIELGQEKKFDLIALDIDLPDLCGLAVCRELKQRHIARHTPIVFVSAQSDEEYRQRGRDAGAVDYITKPFDATDFISRIVAHVKDSPSRSRILEPGVTR